MPGAPEYRSKAAPPHAAAGPAQLRFRQTRSRSCLARPRSRGSSRGGQRTCHRGSAPALHRARMSQRQIEIRTLDRQRRFGRGPEWIVAVEHQREQTVAGPRWRAGRDIGFAGRRKIAMEALAQEMLIRIDRAVIVKIAYAATGDPAQQPWIGRRNLQQVAGGEGGNRGEAINHRAPPGHIRTVRAKEIWEASQK